MFKHLCFALWSSSLLILLASCGDTSSAHSSETNTSPGTRTNTPVSILTNHSIYKATDPIQVTVLNMLSTPIYALDTKASCSILDFEVQINGKWQATSVARCPLGRPAMLLKIEPGKAYTAIIEAKSTVMKDTVFPTGTYRLLLNYSTTDNLASLMSNPTTVYSEPFSITGSAPSNTPNSVPSTQPTNVPPPAAP